MNRHDAVSAGSGIGLAPALVYLATKLGLPLDLYGAAIIGGALAVLGRLLAKQGLRGLARMIWRGSG